MGPNKYRSRDFEAAEKQLPAHQIYPRCSVSTYQRMIVYHDQACPLRHKKDSYITTFNCNIQSSSCRSKPETRSFIRDSSGNQSHTKCHARHRMLDKSRTSRSHKILTLPVIFLTCTIMILLLQSNQEYSSIGCLESPVKIQRNKLQLQQDNFGNPRQSQGENSAGQLISSMQNPNNTSNRFRRNNSEQTGFILQSRNSQANQLVRDQDQCPPSRLVQALLPPEYVGSPASNQRPTTARAHCDCTSDPIGWHFTCFVGSSGTNIPSGSIPMPNQLHPAFRTPQVARQQQRTNQNQSRRMIKRSPLVWEDEEDRQNAGSRSSGTHQEESTSSHEGFGEEAPTISAITTTIKPTRSSVLNQRNQTNSINDRLIENDSDADQHPREPRQYEDTRAQAANEKLIAASSHLAFQTVPVLFSVKYIRNTMIEIDCDQAGPNYKAAMFQGFNVNEITAFTFNNCQLPSVPFSVLLHRTRGLNASLVPVMNSSSSDSPNGNNQLATHQTASERLSPVQSLRPNRLRGPNATGRRRKRQVADGRSRAHDTSRSTGEPRIKSLTINLNSIVDQRTLISLLTGLDQLEDLQLNYMQLNLTSFVANSDSLTGAASVTTTTPSSRSSTPASTHSSTTTSTLPSSSSFELSPDDQNSPATSINRFSASNNINSSETLASRSSSISSAVALAPSATSTGTQALPASSTTSSTTTTTTSSTTTTSRPPATASQATTTANPTPSTTTSGAQVALRTLKKQPMLQAATSATNAPVQQPARSTGSAQTTAPSTLANFNQAQTTSAANQQPATRPPISMGAPRGLFIAQATGIPPAQSVPAPTLAPAQTTTTSAASTTTTTTAAAAVSNMPGQPLVPNVPLSSAVAATRHLAATQGAAQTSTPSSPASPGLRHHLPQHQIASSSQGPSLISVGTSQTHSVSYTSTNTNPARGNSSPTSSSLISNSGISMSASPSNRLHQTPSAWFATPPAAASISSGTAEILVPSSSGEIPASATPPSSMHWSSVNSPLPPMATMAPGFMLSSSSSGLSAPANTPHLSSTLSPMQQPQNSAFGYRTATSTSFRNSISSSPLNSNQAAQTQPQPMPTAQTGTQPNGLRSRPATTNTGSGQASFTTGAATFVVAGGRLHPQSPGQQRRQQMQQQQQQQLQQNGASRSSLSADSLDNLAWSTAAVDAENTAPNGGHHLSKRSTYNGLEEFELSLGELLPNLRTLKLESFLDLSAAAASAPSSRQRQSSASSQLHRFKRQFQPNDMPAKDDDIADEGSPGSSAAGEDTLVAEESTSSHYPSVMASPTSKKPTKFLVHDVSDDSSSVHPALDMDIEPGETLWRSASGDSDSSADSFMHNNGVVVVAPPLANGRTHDDSDSMSQVNSNQDTSVASSSDQSLTRARQMSQILIKLFSKLSKLRVLQMTGNELSYWPEHVLHDSRHSLVRLYLISNNLRQLAPKSFANMSELQTLDLSSNQLRQLDANLFSTAPNLRHLRASRNLFRKLPLRLLARGFGKSSASSKLESIDFSKNRYFSQFTRDESPGTQLIGAVGPIANSLAPLTSLNLSDCSLTDQFVAGNSQAMPVQFFAALNELTSISLQNNKFRDILTITNLFAKNSRLQRLDLSFNQLSGVNGHLFNANASQLSDLQLHHNHLQEIPEQFLFNLRKLRHLSLAYNQITQLSPKLFLTNQLIETIDLRHNQLMTLNTHSSGMIPFGNGANLKYLNLAHNNLSDFEADLFDLAWSFYTSLNLLDLSHNNFAGRISMPIFYTIADEMQFSLSSNKIQSINVDALIQHEQVLDRYATFESSANENVDSERIKSSGLGTSNQHQVNKVPTINIKLSNNPMACDCMLEPLMSYTRRVAAATNPNLLASIFPTSGQLHPAVNHSNASSSRHQMTPEGSRYAYAGDQPLDGSKQPQVLYQFRLNDLHCVQPKALHRRLLSHVSIGDLLCPIEDVRICPKACLCHYQSAFKTAIVDCNGRQLEQIPEQLTDAANFFQFNVELFNSSNPNSARSDTPSSTVISSVDKVIIRLDNNRLTSMDRLARLFNVIPSSGSPLDQASLQDQQPKRFARAPSNAHPSTMVHSDSSLSRSQLSNGFDEPAALSGTDETPENLASSSWLPASPASDTVARDKRKISPVTIGRGIHSAISQQQASHGRRSKRQQPESSATDSTPSEGADLFGPGANLDTNSLSSNAPVSTSVIESAEEFRTRRYPLTCEIYLDHNSIGELPDSFLEQLDRVRASSMEKSLVPPQAALPTNMLEPPMHTKLNSLHLMSATGTGGDPMRASSSNSIAIAVSAAQDPASGSSDGNPGSLFGRQMSPLAPEKKAALMDTISENVENFGKQQADRASASGTSVQQKVAVTPSLVVLSLRYNNLNNISNKMLQRLSKLIKSSNTKLYLGHNPFNCSDNYFSSTSPATDSNISNSSSVKLDDRMLPVSPLGDPLAASDSQSGAYLEPAPEQFNGVTSDLSGSASELNEQQIQASSSAVSDCPVGQLKTWLQSQHAHVGDLDELYCVHMSGELAEKLKVNASSFLRSFETGNWREPDGSDYRDRGTRSIHAKQLDHEHPWVSTLSSSAANPTSSGGNTSTFVTKNGFTWNSEILMQSAKLIDVDLYELCPYSGHLLETRALPLSSAQQQVLLSVAILFILLSLCLLVLLIYFGDTQTILAFVYIHMNPIYNCLRLNETHLDGEKLYDAFVSYSSADRDLVMELIERLEQTQLTPTGAESSPAKPSSLDKSRDALVTEADLRPDFGHNPAQTEASNAQSIRCSVQNLSTMSRSTSRAAPDDSGAGSTFELAPDSRHTSQAALNQVPYRLCIHERDWLPGHLISWNIVNSVQNSRRTILILSKDFIKSVWFQVEFHTAYYQMLEDKIDRLIVIVRGELPPKNELDKNLAFLLTTKTYLTWGEKWFWERLHYALPHRSGGVPQSTFEPIPKPINGTNRKQRHMQANNHNQQPNKTGSLLSTLTCSNETSSQDVSGAKPLLMSNIGKDCSGLLPIVNQQAASSASSSTSSSSSHGLQAARSSSSSYLSSSSSTNNLFGSNTQNRIITTNNDLLSTRQEGKSDVTNSKSTTRLSIGTSNGGMRTSSPLDSGRATGTSFTTTPVPSSGRAVGGVTSIMLDGGASGGQAITAQSKMRDKKQEKLQNFVDKQISNHFNLSEL